MVMPFDRLINGGCSGVSVPRRPLPGGTRLLKYWQVQKQVAYSYINQELLALVRAGIVHLAYIPDPQVICTKTTASFMVQSKDMNHQIFADVLIKGMVEPFYPERDDSLLIKNMLQNRLIRPFRNGNFHPGGIDIDKYHNVVDGNGASIRNLWALGNIAEGPNFYTYVLPRPLANSQAVQDAGKCVSNMLSLLDERHRE
ncbi:unnamed protein product [Didymodactylos carnosus]|uniref:Uncharacterized protein n=1 Tax=Didymodactylos carnosus TaxID=1234261 RepID=A0A815L9B7_9BILA|nr:unnamed protein product [Didymodactylos carnosus]CAF4295067.1 unnamed protein product [Didymodactylos carnosus]